MREWNGHGIEYMEWSASTATGLVSRDWVALVFIHHMHACVAGYLIFQFIPMISPIPRRRFVKLISIHLPPQFNPSLQFVIRRGGVAAILLLFVDLFLFPSFSLFPSLFLSLPISSFLLLSLFLSLFLRLRLSLARRTATTIHTSHRRHPSPPNRIENP